MPRFFFDLRAPRSDVPLGGLPLGDASLGDDDAGMELEHAEAVRREAVMLLVEIAKDVLPDAGDRHEIAVHVRDEQRRPVLRARLTLAVERP